jgi:hypothetical protein
VPSDGRPKRPVLSHSTCLRSHWAAGRMRASDRPGEIAAAALKAIPDRQHWVKTERPSAPVLLGCLRSGR